MNYSNHDEFLKDWTKNEDNKAIQCRVFDFLVHYIEKKDDGKYASVMRELPEIKLKGEFDKREITYAVNNLIRIGYLYEMQRSRGYDIKISKKGYERWSKR